MTLPLLDQMTPADVEDIMPLERQVFTDAWTRRMYLSDITSNPLAAYQVLRRPVPTNEGRDLPPILAWGGFWLMVDECHIATIASHPDFRGCGLGQYLMLALMDVAVERGASLCTLEVRASNESAQGLYHKLGFEDAGKRRRYYRDGEDGLIMTLFELAKPPVQTRLAGLKQEAKARMAACFGYSLCEQTSDAPGDEHRG
jgi:[ribosomal protein S18]-alanine N-acetyltransferase